MCATDRICVKDYARPFGAQENPKITAIGGTVRMATACRRHHDILRDK